MLLWGTMMVKHGLIRAYGISIRSALSASTKNRGTAFITGLGVTALLQSSTATILLLVSFLKKHNIALSAAIAAVIGADLATTLVAQVMVFDLSWLSPALLTIGIIGHIKFEHKVRYAQICRVIIGLGLMLLALSMLRQASAPLASSEILPLILYPLTYDPALAILIAALITWIMHSSLATVLLFASLATNGIINIELGIILILGANIGGALIPLAATYHEGAVARRVLFSNLFMRLAILIPALVFFDSVIALIQTTTDTPARAFINFHTAFNLALAITFLPLTHILAKLFERLIPETAKEEQSESTAQYLEQINIDTPVIALSSCARETLRMAEIVQDMLEESIEAFKMNDIAHANSISKKDNIVDSIYAQIKSYMTNVTQHGLDPKESARAMQIMNFATNLEHIGDLIDKSLMELAKKKVNKKERFSDNGWIEIKSFHQRVLKNMSIAQIVFMSEDPELAQKLIDKKRKVASKARDSNEQHFQRLREGLPATIATSSLHLDIIRDYRQINSFATSVAYEIINSQTQNEKNKK